MKPGGGSVSPEQASLVVQVNNVQTAHHSYHTPNRGGRNQARHKLPVSPTGPRFLPRNIGAVARPLPKTLASPHFEENHDDFTDAVDKRPKYHKTLPILYQHVLQDHTYCAMLPSPSQILVPQPPPPKVQINNGLTLTQNGLQTRSPVQAVTITQITQPLQVQTQQLLQQSQQLHRGYPRSNSTPQLSLPTPPYPRQVPVVTQAQGDDSDISSDGETGRNTALPGPTVPPLDDGEETETAPEDEDSITRCICEFQHDDGYMICCDKCLVWQHVDCMGIERGNIPEEYRCEECEPRRVDKARAIRIQTTKRLQFNDSSDSVDSAAKKQKQSRNIARGGGRKNDRGKGRWKTIEKKPKYKPKQKQRRMGKKKDSTSSMDRSPSPTLTATSAVPPAALTQLRQWIDSYEEAVTNHYSQELRARIAAIKVNGVHSELRLPTNLNSTPKCRVSMLPTGMKMLTATATIQANQAIIEVRGKYMLSKGGGGPMTPTGQNIGSNSHTQRWTPYLFYHKLGPQSSEQTEVCVDTTTYGNDARFVRRSCRPNAEIKHCIEKGVLHLYIVTTTQIEAKSEITLPVRPGHFCWCGSDKCTTVLASLFPASVLSDKRRRGRRRTMSESSTGAKIALPPPLPSPETPQLNNNNNNIKEKRSSSPEPETPPKIAKIDPPSPSKEKIRGQVVANRRATTPATKQEEKKRAPANQTPKKESSCKMTREERKMEAIMKAFERLEKDEARKHGVGTSGPVVSSRTRKTSVSVSPVRERQERPPPKKKNSRLMRETRVIKGVASLRARKNAGRCQPRKKPRIPKPRRQSSDDEITVGSSKKRRGKKERFVKEEEGDADTEGDEPNPVIKYEPNLTPIKLEPLISSGSESTPPAVSNTCLLVAAAVGPLAPGFKFPKSKDPKKNLLNSWFGESGPQSPPRMAPGLAPDCAKKRWLRQAISEDSDSPKQEAVSPTEMAAPLKKRRFARESISSELSFTPPATPQNNDHTNQLYEDEDNSVLSPTELQDVKPDVNNIKIEEDGMLTNGPKTPPKIKEEEIEIKHDVISKEEQEENQKREEEERARVKEEARVKRKLSISEYRERVKSGNTTTQSGNGSKRPSTPVTNGPSSDTHDEETETNLFPPPDGLFKKGVSGFNAAPTLVEQQREALTDRLRREFGLFVSDDEEEKNKRTLAEQDKRKSKAPPPPPPPPPPIPPMAQPWLYYPPPPPPPPPPSPPPPLHHYHIK